MESQATDQIDHHDIEKHGEPPSTHPPESPGHDRLALDDKFMNEAIDLAPVTSIGVSLHPTETEDYGKRPECFSSTLQEILFVLTTTFAVAQTSIIFGAVCVISSHIANDLHMTAAEVTWISAASKSVLILRAEQEE